MIIATKMEGQIDGLDSAPIVTKRADKYFDIPKENNANIPKQVV
jgi:hypothetical protein